MSYTGFFDKRISDSEVCSRVWTMVGRLHGFSTTDEEDECMGGKRRTPEEDAEIVARVTKGQTPEEIAEALDRHPSFVRAVAKDKGCELPSRRGHAAPSKERSVTAPKVARPLRLATVDSPVAVMRAELARLQSAVAALETALQILDPQ
jgi:hypothetical protein